MSPIILPPGVERPPKQFTADWFSHNELQFRVLLGELKPRTIIELGSFEGRATCWMCDHLPSLEQIYCVDTWAGSEEHAMMELGDLEKRFQANTAEYGDKVVPMKMTSVEGLKRLAAEGVTADFIYVDASHKAPDVLVDAVYSWPLLRERGLLAFDDYLWRMPGDDGSRVLSNPKIAVDSFTTIFGEKLRVVNGIPAYQQWFMKMRA